ncbi:DUF2256 domain-containing protein [Brevundimonas sp.]|uniref:DUF2256 domain-containing protein n=1 Tax=Brevundimonas sp. TaxID=1871086 RepID=UPI0035B3BA73
MGRKHVNLGQAPAKGDLPQKVCAACCLPFTWRRKWARDWAQVRFCSDRCRAKGAQAHKP